MIKYSPSNKDNKPSSLICNTPIYNMADERRPEFGDEDGEIVFPSTKDKKFSPEIYNMPLHDKGAKYVPEFVEGDKEIHFFSLIDKFYGAKVSIDLDSIDLNNPTQVKFKILRPGYNCTEKDFQGLEFQQHLSEVLNDVLSKVWEWEQNKDKN